MASACTTAKRPPKLRAACNECHAAKVRCSGEKSGCQRCANLGFACIFSISRIGKVPGKRSKANRAAAAAAAALAASSSSSTIDSGSSTSLPSLTSLVRPNEAVHSFRPLQHPEDDPTVSRPPPPPPTAAPVLTGFPRDPASMITPGHDYTTNIPFYAGDGSHPPEPVPLPDVLPSNPPYILPTNVDLGLGDLSQLSWASELDQLSAYGLPTPGLEMSSIAKAPVSFSDRRIIHTPTHGLPLPLPQGQCQSQSQEWDMDSGSSITNSVDPRRTSNASVRAPITPPDFNLLDETVPVPVPCPSSTQVQSQSQSQSQSHSLRPLDILSCCSTYLQLLHDIEQTFSLNHTHTVDSVLAANQRYLTILLRMTETPGFEQSYDTHLLFTVALSKIIALFTSGYRDFLIRMDSQDTCPNSTTPNATTNTNTSSTSPYTASGPGTSTSTGSNDRLIRFGVFEIDLVEQKAICQSILLRELKRARLCLVRLVDVLGRDGIRGMGRHEGLCEEMSRRLDMLVGSLEGGEL